MVPVTLVMDLASVFLLKAAFDLIGAVGLSRYPNVKLKSINDLRILARINTNSHASKTNI